MPQASITVGGSPGSNDDVTINTLVQLDNQNIGGETTYAWSILSQPSGTADTLSSATVQNPTFTPKKEGTYLVQLVVNAGLSSEDTDKVVVAVRQLKTRTRVPAAGETTENSSSLGWQGAQGLEASLQLLDTIRADPGIVVCQLLGALAANTVVQFINVATLKSGLPGEEKIPIVAVVNATDADIVYMPLGVVHGPVGATLGDGDLAYVRVFGLLTDQTITGAPLAGNPVFVDDSGNFSGSAGSNQRRVGITMSTITSFFFNGLSGTS